MEWSTYQRHPTRLYSKCSLNKNLEVYVIPPSSTPTVLLKEKNSHNPNLYKSNTSLVVPKQNFDSKSSVTFSGNCVMSNNRVNSKYLKEQVKRKSYQRRYKFNYVSDYNDDGQESSDSAESCISLPNQALFEGDRNGSYGVQRNRYLPANRGHVSYLNRSLYLPTPKKLPTPRSENRSMYLPKPKKETKTTSIVEIYERASAPFTSYIVSDNNTSEESSDSSVPEDILTRRRLESTSNSSSDSISIGSMRNELRDNDEIDWNNNLFDYGIDTTDDELEKVVIRSYVPYKEKKHEQPKPKQKNFTTEIKFRKKIIPLEEIMKLDLELISELAKQRAESPKKSSNLISFF